MTGLLSLPYLLNLSVAFLCAATLTSASAATITWTGSVSSDWNNRTNWTPQQVPTDTDTAIINGGNATIAANAQFFALTLNSGNLSGPVLVRTNCLLNWNGGRITEGSSVTIQTNGLLTLGGSAQKELVCPLTNFGRVVLNGSGFYVFNNNSSYRGFITNVNIFDIQGDFTLGNYWANEFTLLANGGALRKTNGVGTAVIGPVLVNGPTGSVLVDRGTLRLDGGMLLDGVLTVGSGAAIDLHGGTFSYLPPSRFGGSGQYKLTGGTLEGLNDYLPNLQLLGGTVLLSPSYQTNGLIVRLDLNGATLGGTSNRVVGVLNAVGGGITGALDVAADGVLNLNGTYVYGPTIIKGAGTMNWSGGRFAPGSSLVVEPDGLANLSGTASKEMAGPMSNYGRVVHSSGTLYLMNNGDTYRGNAVSLGTWEMQGDVSLADYWDNDLPSFGNGGVFRKAAGGGVSVVNVIFYNKYGAVEVLSGALRFDQGQQLDGLFTADAGTMIQLNAGTFSYTSPGRFTGNGLYRLTGGTLLGLSDFLPNWQLTGGTVYLSPAFQTNGTIQRLDLNGATLAGTNQVSGILNFNSGFIAGSLTVSSNGVLNWNGGRFAQGSSLTVASNGIVNLQGGTGKELGGPLTNYGTVNWTGGNLSVLNDLATWAGTIHNFGLWDTRANVTLDRWFGNDHAMFRNYGLLRKSSGTGNSGMDLAVTNRGAIEALTGTIAFTRGLQSSTGSMIFGLGSNTDFGRANVTGTAAINGSLGARLLNGYIPPVAQTFPVMTAGTVSGTFTNTDALAVGFGRIMIPTYTATTMALQAAVTNGINNPPVWAAVPNFTIIEGQPLLYTNEVSDPDGDRVLFALNSSPAGAAINLTNGVLSWTPTTAQGGTSNYFITRIFDSGNPSLMATQSFYVLVLNTNTAPVLPVIAPQLAGVGSTLTVTNTASDLDTPANTLTYSLLSPPAGMSVSTNGVITWTPAVAGSYQVTMSVTDSGTPALSATNTFTVGVVTRPVPPFGLVSWWTADGTTADQNGLNDGTLTGAAGYGGGLFGQAFYFTGGYLTVPGSASLDFGPGSALTVEMWVKRTQAGSVPYYFGKRVGCSSYNYQSPSDLIEGAHWNTPVGQWQHLAWVFTGTAMLGYVDGALVYQVSTTLGPVNAVPLLVGASGTCGASFIGLIDEPRLYNRALNLAEVQALYAGQSVGEPVLTAQPASQMAISGSTVVFNSSAAGAAPLSYQWCYNGAPLSDKTTASLTLPGVAVAQSGDYSVVVSNPVGVVTSDVANLAVIDKPIITLGPQSQLGVVGASVIFTVEATGTPTPVLTYQWRKNGTPISGKTTTALSLANLQVSDSGNYDVVVANWAGTAISLPASLLVSTPIVWNGAVSTDWHNPANWTPPQVPTSTDTALISSGNVSFTINSEFYALTINGGNLFGPVTVGTNALMYWNAGRLTASASLTVRTNARIYISGAGTKELAGPMTNFGHVVLNGAGFTVMNENSSYSGAITNLGTWEMQGDYTLGNYWGTAFAIFGNNGSFRKIGGAGTGIAGPLFLNGPASLVSVETGTLRFDGGMRMDGVFNAASETVMDFHGGTFTWIPPGRLNGPGQYRLTGGLLQDLDDYLSNFQLRGGTVNLSPTYQTNGVIARLDLDGATLGGTSNRVVGLLNGRGGSISGTLEVARDAVANLGNNIYCNGPTLVRSNATVNWSGGRFTAEAWLLVESNAVVNLTGAAQKEMAASMTNFGRVVMAGGSLYLLNNNDVNYRGFIANAGIWDMEGNLTLAQYWDNDYASFGNRGSFRKTAGTGIGIVSLPFVNEGTVLAQSGTLRFDRGMRLEGSFVTSAGAAIHFNAGSFVYVPPNRFTGPGLFALTGGTLQGLDNYLPNFELKGGTVYLSPTYQTNGPIVRLDMNGATLGGSNYVIGVLNATNGGIGGPLEMAPSATVTFAGTYTYGPTLVGSNATFNWLGGRFGTGSSLLVQSNAFVNIIGAADKQMGGPMTNFGSVLWSGGAFTIMNESSSYLGFVTNLGIWEMQGNLVMNQYWGNNNERFGNRGSFLKTSGTGTGVISVPISNPAGFINVLSGTLRFDNGLNLGGQFTAGPATVMQFNAGTFLYTPQTRLLGSGLFRLTGGALQDLGDYLPNLLLQGGSVSLSPTYQTNGPIVRLDLDGATLTGSNRVSGVMNFNSGFVSGPLNILGNGILNWSSGRFAQGSSLSVNSNALANLITSSGKEIGGPLTNSGTVLWTAGGLSLLNDATTWKGSIVNSGIWETRGDLSMDQYFGNNFASFQNNGTLRKTTGTGTATMDLVFVNQGTIEQLSGIWTFGRNFSLTEGTVLFGISSDTAFGRINLTGTASLAGKLAARLLGGYVPATNRTFQVMNYGVVAGTFTDYSGLDVGSGRAFAPVYTSSSLTLQTYATSSGTPIVLSNPANAANYFTFLFTGETDKTYTVQYCTNLAAPVWSTLLVTNIPVSPARVTDLTSSTPNRFYRVKLGSP